MESQILMQAAWIYYWKISGNGRLNTAPMPPSTAWPRATAPGRAGAGAWEALWPAIQHGIRSMFVPSATASQETAQQVKDAGGGVLEVAGQQGQADFYHFGEQVPPLPPGGVGDEAGRRPTVA